MEDDRTNPSPETAIRTIEDEQLNLYLAWAETQIPPWYWPTFAATVSVWIASYSFGTWGGAFGALLAAITFGTMANVLMRRSGITMPRFGSMPTALRWPFLGVLGAHVAVAVAVIALIVAMTDPPILLIAAVAGPGLGLLGAMSTRWYRSAAARLRADQRR